jgi:hypothetical protein
VTGQQVFPFAHAPLGRIARGRVLQGGLATGAGASRREPVTPYPRVSHAAVRVPDPRHTPLEFHFPSGHPQIFVHEGARQALERRLSAANGGPVILSVTDNVRQMVSHTFLTMGAGPPSPARSRPSNGILQLRLHHMFLDAPADVQDALVRYVTAGDRAASQVVGQHIEDNGYRIRASRPVSRPLVTQGATHDLYVLFHAINDKYFGGGVDALITWGRRGQRRSVESAPRRSIKLGSYSATERLIRVHPALDRPWVPRYFVSYIVYHEMLHHVIPGSLGNGRRRLHPPMFVARERVFRDFDRALAWERAHISRLLRS